MPSSDLDGCRLDGAGSSSAEGILEDFHTGGRSYRIVGEHQPRRRRAYGETAALVVVAESILDRPPVGGPAVRSGPSGWSVSGYEASRSLDVTPDDRQVTFLGAAGLTALRRRFPGCGTGPAGAT